MANTNLVASVADEGSGDGGEGVQSTQAGWTYYAKGARNSKMRGKLRSDTACMGDSVCVRHSTRQHVG
eukprot:6200023-Pleurochrysis_carterae.AAC.5